MATSARAAASVAVTGTAPGVRTSTVRAILAGSPDLALVLLQTHRWPAAQRADAITDDPVVWPMHFPGLLVRVGDEARRVHPDRMSGRPELLSGASVEVEVGGEAFGRTADDGEHEWKSVARRADDRLG